MFTCLIGDDTLTGCKTRTDIRIAAKQKCLYSMFTLFISNKMEFEISLKRTGSTTWLSFHMEWN